ncbi:unnamed protein product [Rotaria magnacalcarata]|uniref:Peptidase C14 caspase domain-containing protein n=1 Tax=Rotaria magnacalcarata TaxID=392030 RepID=A0A815PBG2_9BILA|nr:unnamed protein product [Rotaria magnacalcarata]CAF1589406.1 unnamed protein product [Rotaria magnacalcarata]CAF2117393.1 unnamed protein product [Rotaria magnacalcarata]CAF3792288.1 unnamed protein product [Rotaria magnacalcarata]CAF3822838.1 unnamed protein product [Rotaria magnacalcarata]
MTSPIAYRRKCALIIGVNQYQRDSLQYCTDDAEGLSNTLRRIDFVISLGLNCDPRKFYEIIDQFTKTIQRDDLALFYFAGHGKQLGDENYLLSSDYDYSF